MKVIILCGGQGTRLKEETEYKPKPMVLVGGKPIIWHIMKIYAHYGYNEFILALGYKADYIKDFFLNQKRLPQTLLWRLKFIKQTSIWKIDLKWMISGLRSSIPGLRRFPGERILKCKKYIPEKDRYFMVTYGDGVTDLNVNKVFEFHKKQRTIGTITGVHPRSKFGLVKTGRDNLVTNFIEKPVLSEYVNGGYMVFDQRFFDYLEPGKTEHPALVKLAKEKQLSLYNHEGFWMAVDTYKELDDLNKLWTQNKPWKVWK